MGPDQNLSSRYGHRVLLCSRDCVRLSTAAEDWRETPEDDPGLGAVSLGGILPVSLPGVTQ